MRRGRRLHYYTPAQVLERLSELPGLTIRELIDMSEKGIIVPAIESSGQGSPRQYSEDNLLQIAVASSLRTILPPKLLKGFMEVEYSEVIKHDLYFLAKWSKKNNKVQFSTGEGMNYEDTEKILSFFSAQNLALKGFVRIILDITYIRKKLGL
jgi:hypothetical protein